jgi:chromosomal replication initiator protein
MQELVAAMQEGGVERWRARYRSADLLVIDDVQLLVDKERTQDELFHLFNHLVARGSQIVLTSDRPPRELLGVADRLRSRFEGGLVVSLQAPDRNVRERLVARWLTEAEQQSSPELIAWTVDRSGSSVRELRALVSRLTSAAAFLGIPLTVDLAERELHGAAAPAAVVISQRIQPGEIDNAFLDREKTVWEWPDVSGRLVEELR